MSKLGGLFLVAAVSFSSLADAAADLQMSSARRICIGDLFKPKPPVYLADGPFRFPIGCEVVDCCPGCPAAAPIDLKVTLTGTAILSAQLRIVHGGAPLASHRLSRGTREIRSAKPSGHGRVAIAEVDVEPDLAYLRRAVPDARGGRTRTVASAQIEISQTIAGKPVQENHFHLSFDTCDVAPLPREDRIRLRQLSGTAAAITMVDARERFSTTTVGGVSVSSHRCADDRLGWNRGLASVGDLIERSGCNAEASVFSLENAFRFAGNLDFWTQSWETLKLVLSPPLQVPITLWLVAAGSREGAELDVAQANRIFLENRAGFELRPTYVDAAKLALIWPQPGTICSWLVQSSYYVRNQLNAYYIDEIPAAGAVGYHCGPILVEAAYAGHRVLAHEVGHAMGLRPDHYSTANSGDPNPQANLMFWSDGGDQLTLGQAFRINMDPNSAIWELGLRTGTTRSCGTTADAFCPGLGLQSLD